MAEWFWYVLKVSGCLAVFFLFYHVLMRKCTYFRFNRLYLLLGVLLAFAIPLVPGPPLGGASVAGEVLPEMAVEAALPVVSVEPAEAVVPVAANPSPVYAWVLPVAYCVGAILLFTRLLMSVVRWMRICRGATTLRASEAKELNVHITQPFSVFNTIFLPDSGVDPLILEHEQAHVRQRHWIDLLLMEVVSAVLWFNPLVFLYKRALRLQHEYLADCAVAREMDRVPGYLRCMLRQVEAVSLGGLASRFYCKTIKQRVAMIAKNKTSRGRIALICVAIVPLLAGAVILLSAEATGQSLLPEAEKTAVLVDDGKLSAVEEYEQILTKGITIRNGTTVMDLGGFSAEDLQRLGELYTSMTDEQRSQQRYIMERREPFALNVPSQEQVDAWKDSGVYGVWIDEKKVDNAQLNNYKNTDFGRYGVSRLLPNAKRGKNYDFQVGVYTKAYFDKQNTEIRADETLHLGINVYSFKRRASEANR